MLGGLAQRRRFPNEHGDRLAPAALTQERGTEGLVALARQARIVLPEPRAILAERLLDGLALGRRAARAPGRRLAQLREAFVRLRDPLLRGTHPPGDRRHEIALDARARRVGRAGEVLGARQPRLGGGEELGRRLRLAPRQLQHERQVVARVGGARLAREHAAVGVDGAGEVTLGVAHDAERVAGLEQLGLRGERRLQLGARRRPVLARDEGRRQGQPRLGEIGPHAQESAQLLDGAVEVAHRVQGQAQARAGLGEVGAQPQRIAQGHRRRHHLAARDERPAVLVRARRLGRGRRRRARRRGDGRRRRRGAR